MHISALAVYLNVELKLFRLMKEINRYTKTYWTIYLSKSFFETDGDLLLLNSDNNLIKGELGKTWNFNIIFYKREKAEKKLFRYFAVIMYNNNNMTDDDISSNDDNIVSQNYIRESDENQ